MYVDLHMHTHYSDGVKTPEQIVQLAATNGLEAIAITDHDTTASFVEAQREGEAWGIEVIPGVEVSTDGYHILGLGIDPTNARLESVLEESRNRSYQKTEMRVELLKEQGAYLTMGDVNSALPHSVRIGKVNLMVAMLKDKKVREVLQVKSGQEIFRTYLALDTSEIKEIEPLVAIEAIHAAGGIASLAHPFKQVKAMSEIDRLREYGLDRIEIQPNYGKRNIPFIEYAQANGMLFTYGSDHHGLAHHRRPVLERKENSIEKFW